MVIKNFPRHLIGATNDFRSILGEIESVRNVWDVSTATKRTIDEMLPHRLIATNEIFAGIRPMQELPIMGFMSPATMWNHELANKFSAKLGIFSSIEDTRKQLVSESFKLVSAIGDKQEQNLVNSIDIGSAIGNAFKFHQTMIEAVDIGLYNALLHQNHIGRSFLDGIHSHNMAIRNIAEQAGSILRELSNVSFEVLTDGSIAIDDDVVTTSEIQSYLDEALSKDNNAIIQEIHVLRASDKVSARRMAVLNILFTLLFFLFSPALENLRDQYVPWTRAGITTEYKRQISAGYMDRSSLEGFRFVIAEKLYVRSKRTTKSQIIGCLYLGQVVQVHERRNKWTLVEWVDEGENASVSGWVLNKYLRRFK